MNKTGAWKFAEKGFALVLQEFNIPAIRLTRNDNYSKSCPDIEIEGADWIFGDSKYSKAQPYRHHGKIKETEARYCKKKGDTAILFSKNYKEHGGMIASRDRFFAMLLAYWLGKGTKEELWAIYLKESVELPGNPE